MLSTSAIAELSVPFLERQSWFAASSVDRAAPIELVSFDVLAEHRPGLGRVLLTQAGRVFQLLIGSHAAGEIDGAFSPGHQALLGAVSDAGESVVVYDALVDTELAIHLLEVATGGVAHARHVRSVASLTSHASVVYDERLFVKWYRVLEDGTRPEIEVTFALDELGFNALMAPVAKWSAHGYDLCFVREFLPSALEGRLLALTSLRDLLAYAATGDEPTPRFGARTLSGIGDLAEAAASAGGDLSSEMIRLGQTTARLHLALATAFGDAPIDPSSLGQRLAGALGGTGALPGELFALGSPALGRAIRLHGNFHLRRVMRSEIGWLIAGFSDDPLYTGPGRPSLAPRTGSPLEDVADMCFALSEVAAVAVAMRPQKESALARALGAAWTRRNSEAFVRSYVAEAGNSELLPRDGSVFELLLRTFRAERDVRYEAAASG